MCSDIIDNKGSGSSLKVVTIGRSHRKTISSLHTKFSSLPHRHSLLYYD
jgi:hypothetical protein